MGLAAGNTAMYKHLSMEIGMNKGEYIMDDLQKVWNYCEQKKNACDKNVEVIGMDNMLTPIWQTNMGMSNAYWSVQKVIEDIWEQRESNE